MIGNKSERKMIENEAVFRQYNEQFNQAFDELKEMAVAHGEDKITNLDDDVLQFFCECSDENCTERVKLKPSRYKMIHKHRDRFTIVPGHERKEIEKTVETHDDYTVVEKYMTPPEEASKLNKTPS